MWSKGWRGPCLLYTSYPVSAVEKVIGRAAASGAPCAVITGGEPLMHPLVPLTEGLKANGLQVFLETSGTHPLQGEFDWICLSPKRQAPPLEEVFQAADELKVVIGNAEDLLWAEQCAAPVSYTHLFGTFPVILLFLLHDLDTPAYGHGL